MVSAPAGKIATLDRTWADSVAGGIFGLDWTAVDELSDRFVYEIRGFKDARKCPLEGIRDVECGDFAWTPSRLTIYRDAWEGALSGHLARNRAIAIDFDSDTAPFSIGTMHGLLVSPSAGIDSRKKPVFAWYLSRSGSSVSVSFRDVTGDGLEDALYTYRQTMPGGVLVVPCDVWSFADMLATKYLSSGEKLSGVSTSTFEGVPVVLESEGRHETGMFSFGAVRVAGQGGVPGLVKTLTVERGVFRDGKPPSWELQVLADTGEGWLDYLSIMGTPCDTGPSDPADVMSETWADNGGRCSFSELPPDTPIEIRRIFLDMEGVCRFADTPVEFGVPLVRAADMVFRGTALWLAGYPMIASVFFESAAVEVEAAGMKSFPYSMLAAAASSEAISSICTGGGAGQCWNVPGSGYRGLLSDWVLELPGFSAAIMSMFSAWLDGVMAID